MSYKSETIQAILPRVNSTFYLPALQREFVWTADQICALFDSLMRRYPISSFLFWQVPPEARDDVEAYEFLHTVRESRNRARLARVHGNRDTIFVLDGQQRLTSLLVGLQGSYYDRKTKSGKSTLEWIGEAADAGPRNCVKPMVTTFHASPCRTNVKKATP